MQTGVDVQEGDAAREAVPQAVLDAGGESGDIFLAALERCMDGLASRQVLEVISQHPDARSDVPLWCQRAGHCVLNTVTDGKEYVFWIRKGNDPPVE